MKQLLIAAALLMPLSALPPYASDLKAKRDAKVAEINRVYVTELIKLQKRAMAEGNLDAANEINKEIAAATPDTFLTEDEAITKKLRGTSWQLEGSNKVMIFREDGKLQKSWGKLNPEWTVKNSIISVEDSKIKIAPDWSLINVTGGDKDGEWRSLRSK